MLAPYYRSEIRPYRHWQSLAEDSHRTFFCIYQKILNMRSWLLWLVVLTVVVSHSSQQNFNINAILQNDRILLGYYKCVMDKGPCTKDGKTFKRALPEALSTACSRCTSKQKNVFRTMLLAIRAKSEPRFIDLLDKYDPSRENRDRLYQFLATGV